MAQRFKYNLYLFALCLAYSLSATAQYSEQDLRKEANESFYDGAYAEAMPLFSQLLSLDPTSAEYNYKYGATALYGDADKKEEAIKFLRFASTNGGIENECWYFLGRAYHLNYRFDDAIQAYEKYKSLASKKDVVRLEVDRNIESCRSGLNLLSKIKDVVVLEKKQSIEDAFFRIYDLSEIGGKILVTPEELLTSEDKKRNHKSIIHFRGAGSTVYYSSYGDKGETGLDIYRAEVLPDGAFSTPVRLGSSVNSKYDEDFPFFHSDNRTLYFSSKGHGSMGGFDIFKSTTNVGSGEFSDPENLDFAVNTPDDDLFYIADSTKNLANFASARSSKQGNLHVYTVKVNSAPVELTLIKGEFSNQIDPANKLGKITVIDAATNRTVETQFTDPKTGDYVLSIPKSGKYKFLVEVDESDRVHSGIVDVPKSSGVQAYIQEMELITSAGVEKLLINNLFDQTYDGDVMALAQGILKQRASLEVNFNQQDEQPEEEPVVEEGEEFAQAYRKAGFGAGLNNEAVLAQASKRTEELASNLGAVKSIIAGARDKYEDRVAMASELVSKASDLVNKANETSGDERSKLMFKAGVAKMKAEKALAESRSAEDLVAELETMETEVQTRVDSAEAHEEKIRKALETEDFDALVAVMKREAAITSEKPDNFQPIDPEEVFITSRRETKDAAKDLASRSVSLRETVEGMQAELLTKKRQLENAKRSDAQGIESEIERLESDIEDANRNVDRAIEKAQIQEEKAVTAQVQVDMLKSITSSRSGDQVAAATSPASNPINTDARDLIFDNASNIDIDSSAVAQYIDANPWSSKVFDDDQIAIEFKQQYASATESEDQLASANRQSTASGESLVNDDATSVSDTSESEKQSEPDNQTESDPNVKSDSDELASSELPGGEEGKSEKSAKSITDGDAQNDGDEVASSDLPGGSEAKSEKSDEPKAIDDVESDQNTSEVPVEIADAIENENLADASEDQSKGEESDDLVSADVEKRVKAEKLKIQAARDWLEIIDNSIAELESGVGGNEEVEDEDVAAQLDEYRKLRSEKTAEIRERESVIAELDETVPTESNTEKKQAITRAKADLDQLNSGQIAQLESKISEASTSLEYIGTVREIDRDYLPELASIELSGKSAPELARERKALNEQFLSKLDQLIQGEASADIPEDELLEMRRIKYLEIIQDEKIMTGRGTYTPRTPEAREYAALISDTAEMDETAGAQSESFTDLSPELAADLQTPYRKDLIFADYESEMQELESAESDSMKFAGRIELNEKFLRSLSSEIQLYAAAAESSQGESQKAVSRRYNKLIAERSAVVDEISADKKALIEISELTSEELARTDIAESTAEETIADEAASEPSNALTKPDDLIAIIEESYSEEISAIETSEADNSTKLKRKADLNFNIAQEIDSIIELQVVELDKARTDSDRNAIQQNIQELESIAADKRQEADRFMFESDEPEVVASETQNAASAEAKTGVAESDDADLAVEDVIESLPDMDFLDLKYVSLNANVKYNSVKPGLDSAAALRTEIEEKVNQYEATQDAEVKREMANSIRSLRADILEKESRITREIAESNQAELKYYSNSNKSLIRQLEVIGVMDGSDEAISAYKAQNAAIAERLNKLQSPDKTDLSNAERIAEEQEIIASMATLYAEMDREIEIVEKQDSLLAANEPSEEEIEERLSPYETLLENPENLKPEPGRSYLAPIHTKVANQMSDARKAELKTNTSVLNLDQDFPDENDEAELKSMVSKATPVDERGFEILKENPNQMQFLVSAIKADSLKEMELITRDFSEKMGADAREKYREVERLRNVSTHEDNTRNKQLILERAEALELEAKTNLERAALSSYQAESLRRKRLDEEENLAQLASKLSPVEIAETRALVDNKTYKIIPADLASDELAKAPEAIEKKTADKASQEDKSQDVAADDLDLASAEELVDEDVVVDSRANSSDEEKLMKTAGTWLGMVEIIAERNDFSDVEESLFIEVDKSVYSERKPIPINPTLPNGLFFQVQIGAFRNPIPQDLYGEIAPVMGEKLGNGITRYRAGIFKNYGDAVKSRNLIRSKGYSDAFVVAYVDGERLTGEQAQDILRQLRKMETEDVADATERSTAEAISSEKAPKLGEEATAAAEDRSVDYYSDPEAAVAKQVEVTPGLFYTVQVGVYSKPVKLAELFNLTDLNTELTESGYVRYTTGRYANLDNARSRKVVAVDKGVSDAFITAYYNGKRISIADAQAILEKEGTSALSPEVSENSGETPNSEESKEAGVEKDYVVILGSFAGDIPQSLADLFLENPEWQIKKVDGPNNQSMYIASDFQSKEEAKAFLTAVRNSGIQSAVLGELTNGQISAVGME